jgi:hypothetical protein
VEALTKQENARGAIEAAEPATMRLPTPHGWGQGIGSVVAGESGGTSRWSHGLCYLFSALRRDGLIPDKLSLNLPALLRSLNLFLKLRVWTVPHCLTTYQPRHGGKQDKHGPELSRFHSSTSVHGQAPHEVLRLTLARLTNCAPPRQRRQRPANRTRPFRHRGSNGPSPSHRTLLASAPTCAFMPKW